MNELYKLILVDDEDEIRGRIASMITEESGFKIVASASNGFDALELIEEHTPHAVLTDIRMPFVDGITLAQTMRTEFPNIKVAFLTGFGEFDYARKAVELDIVSYLMKPVTKTELHSFLLKLRKILDDEYNLINNIEFLEENVERNRQLYIERQLNSYLSQSEIKEDDLSQLGIYNLDFSSGSFVVGIIEFSSTNTYKEILKTETFIREYLATTVGNYDFIIPFSTTEGLAFLIKGEKISEKDIEYTIQRLLTNIKEQSKTKIRIGLSSIFRKFVYFSTKFHEASSSLSVSRFTNTGDIVSFEDIQDTSTIQAMLTSENIREIEYVIRFESEEDINSLFDKFLRRSKEQDQYQVDYQLYIIATSNIILKYALSLGVKVNDHFKNGLLLDMLALDNIKDILQYTKTEIIRLRNTVIDKSNTRLVELADNIISFVETRYNDPTINLDMIADEFNLSISYLSNLLRKEKQTTFNKYLIRVRIDKAKELLKYTNLKIVEVAKQVGYNDVYYFSHSFKKNTQMSPKEYRENVQT